MAVDLRAEAGIAHTLGLGLAEEEVLREVGHDHPTQSASFSGSLEGFLPPGREDKGKVGILWCLLSYGCSSGFQMIDSNTIK